jgi:hypothetical protein
LTSITFHANKPRGLHLIAVAKASSVPERTQTAVLASSGAANPTGSQFLAHLSRTGLYVIAHAGRSSAVPTQPDQPKNCVTRLSVPASSVSVENRCFRPPFRVALRAKREGSTSLHCAITALIDRYHADEPQTVYVGLIGLGLLCLVVLFVAAISR